MDFKKKKCKIKSVGALKGRWRVDCKQKVQNQEGWGFKVQIAKKKWKIIEGWGIKGHLERGLQKKS